MVYVDHMQASYRRMKMCHMLADSDEELHAMAERIGVARRHHQKPGTPHSHYDICRTKRKLAVKAGAIEITRSQLGALIRLKRTQASQAVGAQPSSQTTKGTAVPTPDLVTCPKDEYEAMCAVMATLDPATVPGLTVAQRCALGRFAKPYSLEDTPTPESGVPIVGVNELRDTLEKIADPLGPARRRPELLRLDEMALQPQTIPRTLADQQQQEAAVWEPSALEIVPACIDNSLKRAAEALRATGHDGDAIDASRVEFLRRLNARIEGAAGNVPDIKCISFSSGTPSGPHGMYVRYEDHCAVGLAYRHQLLANEDDAARWRWIQPLLELESDHLYEFGTARYSLIHLKGDQIDLPPSPYYKDVVAGVDAARALARKQNG